MSERFKALADSYLDHIRIAVEVQDRGAPFRDFLDNWNAFHSQHDHHRSRGDRPRWFNNPSALSRAGMLGALDFRSADALAIIDAAANNPAAYRQSYAANDPRVRLVVDHAVPISVMKDELLTGKVEITRDGIQAYLKSWYRLGLISYAEDAILRAMSLQSAMPTGWDSQSVFARYEAAGIEGSFA